MIVSDQPATREAWLDLRRDSIGASEAAALLGIHPYISAFSLWAEKTGLLGGSEAETAPMRRGRLMEAVAVQMVAEDRPDWTLTPNPIPGGRLYRDTAARMSCTPDLLAIDPAREGSGVIQIKSVEPSAFRKGWRNEDGQTEPPLWITIQAIIEAHLTGATWAAVAALVIGYGIDLHMVEVPLHAKIIDRLRSEVAAFWRMVETGKSPAADYGRDADLLARIYAEEDGTELDLRSDNQLPALVAEKAVLSEGKTAAEKRLKEIKAELLDKIGSASVVRLATGTLTAKTIRRGAYSVTPTSYRDIRFKPDRELSQ